MEYLYRGTGFGNPSYNLEKMSYYKRKLPHWQPEGAEYFITIRLKGTLPKSVIDQLKKYRRQIKNTHNQPQNLDELIQRKTFEKYEHLLDRGRFGPVWLKNNRVAKLVEDAIHFRDRDLYDLYASCIMPNHLHMVFKHRIKKGDKEYPITDILRNFKRYTARKANELLQRSGAFWQSESYDRVIRDSDELEKTIRYVLNNPVKARLVQNWEEWAFTYCKPTFIETFT